MPRVCIDHYSIRIYFGEVLHLYVKRLELLGLQSWRDGEHSYSIEFTLTGGSITAEYDDADKWRVILKALDDIL